MNLFVQDENRCAAMTEPAPPVWQCLQREGPQTNWWPPELPFHIYFGDVLETAGSIPYSRWQAPSIHMEPILGLFICVLAGCQLR